MSGIKITTKTPDIKLMPLLINITIGEDFVSRNVFKPFKSSDSLYQSHELKLNTTKENKLLIVFIDKR